MYIKNQFDGFHGEISPGWLIYYGQCLLKITEVAQIFGPLFSTVNVRQHFFKKTGLGNTYGDFFVNSSAHPFELAPRVEL
jgi:hypothetical protein